MIAKSRRKLFLRLALAVGAVVVFVVGCEVGLRIIHTIKNPSYRSRGSAMRLDPDLGWVASEHYILDGEARDTRGNNFPYHYTTQDHGFRMWGNPRAGRFKILVIGDSMTQAESISTDKTYFAQLGRELDAEIFAYGCGGYGTLQELMILKQYFDEVKPEIIVWQFCSNDLINNDYGLERESHQNSNGMRRPYRMENGEIERKVPARLEWLREFGMKHSELVNFVFARVDRVAIRWGEGCEDRIARVGGTDVGFRRSVATTGRIVEEVKSLAGSTQVVGFCADSQEPYRSALRGVWTGTGLKWTDAPNEAIAAADASGKTTRLADGAHWNEEGHRVVGEALAGWLKEQKKK